MDAPTDEPHEALRRLEQAAASGDLARSLSPFGVRLLVVFGSTIDGSLPPRDLDVAFAADQEIDVLDLRTAIYELTGFERVDLVDLDRANLVLRAEALCGHPLLEASPGAFAEAQMYAITRRLDTQWLRDLDLETMAG